MLLSLASWLQTLSPEFGFLRVFQYITFRAVMAAMTSLLIGLIAGPWVIRHLASLKIGQPVRGYGMEIAPGQERHARPWAACWSCCRSPISTLLWFDITNRFVWIVLAVTLGFGAIGWVDDWRKVVHKDPEGMRSREKYFWQSLIGLLAALYLVFSISESSNWRVLQLFYTWVKSGFDVNLPPKAGLLVPFFKEVSYPLGVFGFVILTYLVIVGSSNAVNLTDGLDGLAIMPVVMVGSALGVFAYVTGSAVYSKYLFFPHIPGSGELLIFCAAMAGAGLAFLWFNTHPAQVFMGDVGALALGGALGTIAVIVRQEIVLAIMGGIFVVEAMSVMAQVMYFKYTKKRYGEGRRILKMAPLHHHFEKSGWTRNAGRRALLDHHHAAVPGRPVHAEAEVTVEHLQDQHVLILGLGASGLAMARWCARCGAQVTVADTREAPPQLPALREQVPQARFVAGAFDAALLEDGGAGGVPQPGPVARAGRAGGSAAREAGLPVGGELSLFAGALADLQGASRLRARRAGRHRHQRQDHGHRADRAAGRAQRQDRGGGRQHRPHAAGHAGREDGRVGLAAGLGASSCRASSSMAAGDFEPTAAAVLNVTQDHLDWHGDMEAYAAAKARVFGKSGLMILNREDPLVMKMLPEPVRLKGGKMEQRPVPDLRRRHAAAARRLRHRGRQRHGLAGARAGGRRNAEEAQGRTTKRLHFQRLMPADALRIRGRHNAVNALSALALASAAGCPLGPMLYGLREYRGEPHRVEPVGIVNEIEYFDDSKGTNVGATVAALQGLGAERKVVVILGGDGKGQDFSPLARRCRATPAPPC